MSQSIVSPAPVHVIGEQHMEDRVRAATVRRDWRRARQLVRQALDQARAYDGSPLAAEQQSRAALTKGALKRARHMARAAWCSRQGRKIDLAGLLRQLRPDGKPVWTIVLPDKPVGPNNGAILSGTDTDLVIRTPYGPDIRVAGGRKPHTPEITPTGGIPPLPPAARRAVTNRKIRQRALWVGLLYQPQGWEEKKPDPAIVVEWKDRPGEYYALVVWGGDYHRIMEWVD